MPNPLKFKFGKRYHLKSKKEIKNIFKNGKKKVQNYILFFYIENNIGFKFAVSFKKNIFRSSERNYIRRRIKEFIRLNQYFLKKIDCVIVVLKHPLSFHTLFRELNFLLV